MKVCRLAKVDIGSAGRLDSSGWIWNQQQVTLLTPAFHCFQCQRLCNEWQILQTYNYVQNIKIKLFLPSNWWIQDPRWFWSDFLALETSAALLTSAASTTSLTRNSLYSPVSPKNFLILMIWSSMASKCPIVIDLIFKVSFFFIKIGSMILKLIIYYSKISLSENNFYQWRFLKAFI